MVGGIETTKPSNVQSELISLIGKYEIKKKYSFEDIIGFHYQFECIHPFQDGNGRVGRLIAFKECLRHGFVPFTIDESIKLFYYRGLKEWKNEKEDIFWIPSLSGQDKYRKLLDMFNISYE